jgi:hypothetical protein
LAKSSDSLAAEYSFEKYKLSKITGTDIVTFPKSLLGENKRLGQFQNIQVQIPEFSEQVLSYLYGEYMKLPPEEDRFPHHHLIFYSLTTPYAAVDIKKITDPFLDKNIK